MNVLMTADAVGGVWTYAIELARALSCHDIGVTLATMGSLPSAAQRAQAAGIPGLDLRESGFRLEWQDDPWVDVRRAGEWLLRLAESCGAEVVHLNGYAHAALPWGRPVMVVAHSCVRSWWRAVRREPAPADWAPYAARVASGLAAADLVVAPTHAMLRALRDEYPCRLRRTRVIPNGRRAGAYRPGLKEPFVLTAGRLWDEGKNVSAVVAAAPRLPWPVFAAGAQRSPDGRERPLRNVHALGRLPEGNLAEYMAQASVFALPARYEPFGLAPLEAGLAGCALVLGDIPSLREVWGDTAAYVDPDSSDDLAFVLQTLCTNDRLRHRFARAAHDRARALTPERMADAYLGAYRELVAPAAGAARPDGGVQEAAV